MESKKIIKLNVGGTKYQTTIQTLTKQPNSNLSKLFSDDQTLASTTDDEGNIFLDRDGKAFGNILQILRGPSPVYPSDNYKLGTLLQELRYFNLEVPNDVDWELIDTRYQLPKLFYISSRPIVIRSKFYLQWLNEKSIDFSIYLYFYPKEVNDNELSYLCEKFKNDTPKGIKFNMKFNSLYLLKYDAIGGNITITENDKIVKQIRADFAKFTLFIDNSGARWVEPSLIT